MQGFSNFTDFPGYQQTQEQKKEHQKQKEQKREQKKQMRIERRKNALPPFLMVRAGVYNHLLWCIPMFFGGIAMLDTPSVSKELKPFMVLCAAVLLLLSSVSAVACSSERRKEVKNYYDRTKINLQEYSDGDNKKFVIYSDKYKGAMMLLIRHLARYDANLFNNMIKNPESVLDTKIAENIILGHMKSHPEDARAVLDRFWSNTMPKRLRKKLKYIAWEQQQLTR